MNIKAMGNRRSRSLARGRSIRSRFVAANGGAFLLLIILWPLNAAGSEREPKSAASNMLTGISVVGIAENIIVGHAAKQEAVFTRHYQGYFLLITLIKIVVHAESHLSWPYCGYSREWIRDAPGKFGIFCVIQTREQTSSIENDAIMWRSGWGGSVVLEVITEDGARSYCGSGKRWLTVDIRRCKPEAIKNRADIGAELPSFGIADGIRLSAGGIGEPTGRIDGILSIDAGETHLGQLITDKEIAPHGGATQYYGSNGQNSSPIYYPSTLMLCFGIFLIGTGCACTGSGVAILSDSGRRSDFFGIGLLFFGAVIVFHGIGFLLLPFNKWPIP